MTNLIVNTQVSAGSPYPNGSFWVIETQIYADKTVENYTYLANTGVDHLTAARDRAVTINQNNQMLNVIPSPISAVQARRAIVAANLTSTVSNLISSANSDVQKLWYETDMLEIDNPVLDALATGIGLSNTQLQQLFIQASQL